MLKRLSEKVGHHLPVSSCKIGSAGHGGVIVTTFTALDRRTCQLAVWQVDTGTRGSSSHDIHIISADLMAQPTGSGMYHHTDLIFEYTKGLGCFLICLLYTSDAAD